MTNTFSGAILLLNETPDDDTADNISKDVAAEYFPPNTGYQYRLTNILPENTPVDLVDQYTAALKDLPLGATYLIVSPVEESKQL